MKKIQLLAIAFLSSVLFLACDQEDSKVQAPSPEEIIARTWIVKSISVTENETLVEDVTEYLNLTINIKPDGTYTVANASHAFEVSSGIWKWADESVKKDVIITEDGADLYITVNKIQADLFEISFQREGQIITEGGRTLVIPKRVFEIVLKNL
jgi:hypothetical protein